MQDWQPYLIDPYACYMRDHICTTELCCCTVFCSVLLFIQVFHECKYKQDGRTLLYLSVCYMQPLAPFNSLINQYRSALFRVLIEVLFVPRAHRTPAEDGICVGRISWQNQWHRGYGIRVGTKRRGTWSHEGG